MADPLMTELIRVLRQLPERVSVTAEELCDALWLYQQGVGVDAAVSHAVAPLSPVKAAFPSGQIESSGRVGYDRDAEVVALLPAEVPDTPDTRRSTTRIALRGGSALPEARELSRALRPLRHDPFKTHRADGIDEQATATRIAQTGMRDIVWRTSRRRRLDLDLVLDLGGSGPIWRQLAAEIRTMLETHGAFRSVRCWELDSDADPLPLRPAWIVGRRANDAVYSESVIYQAPRKPLIVVLTDGAGRGWQSSAVHEPLRRWATHGTVLLVQLLPARMWQRTSLAPLPVTFHPADDGYHSGRRLGIDNTELYELGLDRKNDLPAAIVLPVIGLSPEWLRSWLPLLRGTQAGSVSGYALVIPPRTEPAADTADAEVSSVDADQAKVALEPEERVQRFLLSASQDAIKLARLLSASWLDLSVMRKIRSELIPRSEPGVMAEVLLGGLIFWTSSAGTLAPPDTLKLEWHEGVEQLMKDRPGGPAELERDWDRVAEALVANRGPDKSFELLIAKIEWVLKQIDLRPLQPLNLQFAKSRMAATATKERARLSSSTSVKASAASSSSMPGTDDAGATPGTILRVGLFGSTQSGRTTFLTILAMAFSDWADVRPDEQWKFVAASPSAEFFVKKHESLLRATGQFPPSDTPTASVEQMLFKLERRTRRRGRGLFGWQRPVPVANITVSLQDWAGAQFVGTERSPDAARYLAASDALVYFFDPTYDDGPRKEHSADFFNAVETDLALNAAIEERVYEGRLPQHIAVCVPKLDQQWVFDVARGCGLLENDPINGLPWVPPRNAKRLFERIVAEQRSIEGDYLVKRLNRGFHPRRTSYHALSSVGFWVPEGGAFDPTNVCNVIKVPSADSSAGELEGRVRGTIRPVHIFDPFISVIERAAKGTGRP
jgi:hypothetical protein